MTTDYRYRCDPEESAALAPPELISFPDFTEKYITLDRSSSAEHGPKRISRTPALRAIYEALDHPDVREVNVRKSAQLAVTSLAFDLIAYTIVQRPRPIAYFLADQSTAEKVGERLRVMLRNCTPVAALINDDRFNKSEMVFRNGASVTLSWGSSIAATGSTPFGMVIIDEADKPGYDTVGKEGSALARIRERFVTYADYKLFIFSTPTLETGNVTKELEKCPVIVRPFVPCPFCGAMQPLYWRVTDYVGMDGSPHKSGFVYFDNDATDNQSKAVSARYQCGECEARWTTIEKNEALARCQPYPFQIMPRMGFDGLSRLYSLFEGGRLEVMVSTWLDAQADVLDLQTYINSVLGEVWRRHKIQHSEDQLRAAETDLPAGVVPDAADCLVSTIDMQQHGFWYLVRAWQASPRKSWLVECGELGNWDDIDNLIFERSWQNGSGRHFNIWRAGIDSGGGKDEGSLVSRTEELYSWYIKNLARAYGKVWLCKGSSRAMPQILNVGKVLASTPSGRKIDSYGLRIVTLSTQELKRLFLHGLQQAIEKGSQAAYLHKNMPPQYYRHITAEAETDSGDFERIRPDNHLFDCEATQYAMVNRLLFGGADRFVRGAPVQRQQTQPQEIQPQSPRPPQPTAPNPFTTGTSTGGNPFTGRWP